MWPDPPQALQLALPEVTVVQCSTANALPLPLHTAVWLCGP